MATKKIAKQLEDLRYTGGKFTKARRERLTNLGVLNTNGNYNYKRDVRIRKLMSEAEAINNKAKASKVAKAKKARAKAAKARRKATAAKKPRKAAKKVGKKATKKAAKRAR
jgi:hypothetical protein